MLHSRGRTIPLSIGRRIVVETLHHAKEVPSIPLSRFANIASLLPLRRQTSISWMAIFLKAYALVAQEMPCLRRSWIKFPWPRLYEHPTAECMFPMECEYQGETLLLGAKLAAPAFKSLREIDQRLRRYRSEPVEACGTLRQQIRAAKLPFPLRRLLSWTILHVSGTWRAKYLGTFLISSLGNLGVEQMHPLSPLTTYFSFGPIADNGDVTLKIIYDHRVLDAREVALALNRTEEVLNNQIADELRTVHESIAQKAATVR